MVRGLWVPKMVSAVVLALVALAPIVPGAWAPHALDRSAPPSRSTGLYPSSGAAVAAQPAALQTALVLSVPGLLPTEASLTWTSASNVGFDNYTVFQSSNSSGGPWAAIGFIAKASTTTFVAASLTPGSPYWWEVQSTTTSLLAGVTTQTSNVDSATTPGLAYLNVTLLSPTTAELNWTDNATYGGGFAFGWYEVEEVAGTSPPALVVNLSSESAQSTGVSGLSAGASYAFYVTTSDCVSGCGTAHPGTVATPSNVVTIGTPETLVASINSERSVVDVGQPDLFTCTPTGGRSPYTVSWNNGDGTFVPGPGTESVGFNASGTPTVQCRIQDADSSTSEAGAAVAVNAAPIVTAGTNRSAVDVGGPIAFHCIASGGTAPISLTWVFGDGGEAGIGDTTHAYAAPAQEVATCTATDYTGTEVGNSYSIAVSSAPDVTVSASSNFAAPGTLLSFTGHASNGSGNASALAWTFGDGTRATGPNSTHAFQQAGSFDVEVRTVDSNGVTAEANSTVVVSPIAVAVTAPAGAVRTGTGLWFNASASGGAGAPYNFSWTFGDGSRSYGASVHHAYRSTGTYAPTLTVTDRLGASVGTNLTKLGAAPPPSPPVPTGPSWWILLAGAIALIAGTMSAMVVYRRIEADRFGTTFRWVPFTDPSRTLRGVRVCRNCGTPNNAAREGCSACGAPIGTTLFG